MLHIDGLTKTYGDTHALDRVSLDVEPGVFGLLGPNGAGKSTLMKILATLLEPDAGRVFLRGIDVVSQKLAARRMLGYLPQEFGFYATFTAEQLLHYFARLKGVYDRNERTAAIGMLLDRVNLTDARRQPAGEFSGGMRQRLGIAQALIGSPKLLIVDEPTAGLDPEERNRFHNLLAETAGDDAVVLLSTHIVADITNLCSRFAIIRDGRIIALTSPRDAVSQIANAVWEGSVRREQLAAITSRFGVISLRRAGEEARVRVLSRDVRPSEEFSVVTPTLEDYYFSVINEVPIVN